MTATLRAFQREDRERVLQINRECVPAVGPLDVKGLDFFLSASPFLRVAELHSAGGENAVVGFLIGLDERSVGYQSPNFKWFQARHERFAYVDRIAITESGRRGGLGRAMYAALEKWARVEGHRVLCAEVNTVPDNPTSHAFHRRLGFAEVARTRPYDPEKEVAMYEKMLPL